MKLRMLIVVGSIFLALSACVVEPYRNGHGDNFRSDNNQSNNRGYYGQSYRGDRNQPYRGDRTPQNYGSSGWH
jgi:hypothetical protein